METILEASLEDLRIRRSSESILELFLRVRIMNSGDIPIRVERIRIVSDLVSEMGGEAGLSVDERDVWLSLMPGEETIVDFAIELDRESSRILDSAIAMRRNYIRTVLTLRYRTGETLESTTVQRTFEVAWEPIT